MSGVTPREAQAHVDKGGVVESFDQFAGEWVSHNPLTPFRHQANQDTPRPQWRLVPIPEPTVTIEVPRRWAEAVASGPSLLVAIERDTDPNGDVAVRQACIKATMSGADAERSDAQGAVES